jgi:hypothetical protein
LKILLVNLTSSTVYFRFEAEISGQTLMNAYSGAFGLPGFGNIPPPPQPPLLIPHQVKQSKKVESPQRL